jgi:hypothetical protein
VILDRFFDVVALAFFLCVSLPRVIRETWLVPIAVGSAALVGTIALGLVLARGYTGKWARDRRQRGVVRRIVRDTLEGLATPLGRRRIGAALALSVAA